MSSRRDELARRRELLVARAEAQRVRLSSYSRQMEGPVVRTGAVLGLLNSLRRSPWAITGLTLLLVKTPWRRLARVPKLAWRAWQFLQFARRWLR